MTIDDEAALPRRVLVVEDESLIRMIITDHLRDAGYAVTEAGNGDEAIARLAGGDRPDLVLTDVRMPGEADGMAVLAFIAQTCPAVPVIVTSGHLPAALARQGGAADFIAKPFDLDELLEVVRLALNAAGPPGSRLGR